MNFKTLNEFTEGLEFSGQNEPEELSGEFQPPCTFELVILCLSITWRNFYRVEISAENVLPCSCNLLNMNFLSVYRRVYRQCVDLHQAGMENRRSNLHFYFQVSGI